MLKPGLFRLLEVSNLSLQRQPFLYLLLSYVAGVVLERWAEPSNIVIISAVALLMLLSGAAVARGLNRGATVLIIAAAVAVGAALSSAERTPVGKSRLKHLYETNVITGDTDVRLTGILAAPPDPAPGGWRLDIHAEHVSTAATEIVATGRVRATMAAPDRSAADAFLGKGLVYGSRIRALVRLEQGRTYKNPGSPDFNYFLERRGYDLRGRIANPAMIERLGETPVSFALDSLFYFRLWVLDQIDARLTTSSGTMKAMLLGNRNYLDPATSEKLLDGGTFHVLSVSGLHVGIIALVLLGGARGRGRSGAFRLVCSLFALWTYAVMVGLEPPITRATLMISVGLIGPLIFRRSASINTVALSAFLMLAVQPRLVADPAFQLSFAAVGGIVAIALPATQRLRSLGEWRPSALTPYPPSCFHGIRLLAEAVYWDERRFAKDMSAVPLRYRLDKSQFAGVLGKLRLQPVVRAAALLMITSLAINVSTLPLMVLYFNRVAPISILLNVVAGLLTGLLMLTTTLTVLLGVFSDWISTRTAWIVEFMHLILANMVEPFTGIPGATFRTGHYEGWASLIYALYFGPLFLLSLVIDRWAPVLTRNKYRGCAQGPVSPDDSSVGHPPGASDSFGNTSSRSHPDFSRLAVVTGIVLCLAIAVVVQRLPASANGNLVVHFLDVGQGDSALVVFPGGSTMLVDGGGQLRFGAPSGQLAVDRAYSVGEIVVSRFLWALGISHIDYVVVSHADADHIGGLVDVVRNFSVGEVVLGRTPSYEPEYARLAALLSARKIPVGIVGARTRLTIEGSSVEVLWPPPARLGSSRTVNDESVVLRITYGSVAILLTGDIESTAETELVRSGTTLRADVLKVPHHGSRTSSTGHFIDAVKPRYAVVPVGERSRFGHPHQSVMDRFTERGIELLQTGKEGTVKIETDGTLLSVSTFSSREL